LSTGRKDTRQRKPASAPKGETWPSVLLLFVLVYCFSAMLGDANGKQSTELILIGGFVFGVLVGALMMRSHQRSKRAQMEQRDATRDEVEYLSLELAKLRQRLGTEAGATEHQAHIAAAGASADAAHAGSGSSLASTAADHATHSPASSEAKDAGSAHDGNADLTLSPESSRFSTFTLDGLSDRVVGASDPLAELRLIEADIASREEAWAGRGRWSGGKADFERRRLAALAVGNKPEPYPSGPDPDPESCPIPSGVELFLAHRLRESGLFDDDVELPHIHIVRPHNSDLFYLRVEQPQTSYAAMLVVLRIEAALNAVRFICVYHDDPMALTERDCICFMQRLTSSVVAQAEPIDVPIETEDKVDPEGEWAVRRAISQAIESFQLPYRLNAQFRSNVADGNVAFELAITPSEVFPKSYYPADYPTANALESTRTSRRQLASAYALRVAVLLAACAFRTTSKIKHVWVAGIHESATRHDCYFSIDFDRWRFARLDLENVDDLERELHPFCPVMRLEDGFLRPVRQTFALSEERFCPRRRYESVSLSSRRLPHELAHLLGTDHVSGLAIGEADKRELVANDILRRLESPEAEHATERNVRAILEIAGDDPDPSVRSAAERTASALVHGTISDDPFSVAEEFAHGDELSRACEEAVRLLQERDIDGAWAQLAGPLGALAASGLYADSATVEWRHFSDFVDRTLYNRLREHPERSLMLVPESYYEAQSIATTLFLAQDKPKAALEHARELLRIAPLDTRAHLQLVRCLEANEQLDEAIDQLRTLLNMAHDPQSVGTAYYRMAFFQWQVGNTLAARACYAAALRFIPGAAPQVAMEVATLALQGGLVAAKDLERDLTPNEVVDTLEAHNIPSAPTDKIAETFYECARASVDAEVFPVARNFLSTLTAFTPDDVIVGLLRSLEDAPDSL
jgi:tetratricopeptide (TPR) repeat protein